MSTFRFHATRVTADGDEDDAPGLGFEVEPQNGGDATVFFSMLRETPTEVRVWWNDGTTGEDERVLTLIEPRLTVRSFTATLSKPLGSYTNIEISFGPLETDHAASVRKTFSAIGKPPPKLKRVRGAPGLALASNHPWNAAPRSETTLELVLSNIGGAFRGAITLTLSGPAIDGALVTPVRLDDTPFTAAQVTVPVDIDAMFAETKSGTRPPPPTVPLRLQMTTGEAGSALLFIRLTAKGQSPVSLGRPVTVK